MLLMPFEWILLSLLWRNSNQVKIRFFNWIQHSKHCFIGTKSEISIWNVAILHERTNARTNERASQPTHARTNERTDNKSEKYSLLEKKHLTITFYSNEQTMSIMLMLVILWHYDINVFIKWNLIYHRRVAMW